MYGALHGMLTTTMALTHQQLALVLSRPSFQSFKTACGI
jgi:hypothetical protein